MRRRPSCLLQSAGGEVNRILLASALSSMHIICPKRVNRRDWIIAVSLGWFVSLRTSSFRTNWYHLMPSSIRRHHWSTASILRVSVLDISQQSEPYRNIGKMHVLYSFNFVEMASRNLQTWFSKLCMAARVMETHCQVINKLVNYRITDVLYSPHLAILRSNKNTFPILCRPQFYSCKTKRNPADCSDIIQWYLQTRMS